MITTRASLRAGALALGLMAAGAALAADGFSARDGVGATVQMLGHTLGVTGQYPTKLPLTGLTDAAGADIGVNNPLRVAPGIAVAVPLDRGGTIQAANVPQQPMGPNAARKGGWIQADPGNAGTIYVSRTGTASTSGGVGSQCALGPGATCPLTVNGYVVQTAVSVAGTTQGDKFSGEEDQ